MARPMLVYQKRSHSQHCLFASAAELVYFSGRSVTAFVSYMCSFSGFHLIHVHICSQHIVYCFDLTPALLWLANGYVHRALSAIYDCVLP